MTPCDDPYPWLSEFLCDYVDGEMPAAEQAAFDEWLRGDPLLAAHVAGLVRTRRICCQSQAPKAPCDFVAALHRRLVAEGLEEAPSPAPAVRPRASRRVDAAPAGAPLPLPTALETASSTLLMRSALLLLVLSAVAVARFAGQADAYASPAADVATLARAGALATLAPVANRSIQIVPSAQVFRRPARARFTRTHVERPAAARAAFRTNALLRIRAGR